MDKFTLILKQCEPFTIAVAFVSIYIAEHVWPQHKDRIDYKHDVQNFFFGIINLAVAALGGFYLQKLLLQVREHNFGLLNVLPDLLWLRVTIGFVFLDLFMYWWHRANHELRFLWQFHRFHHKDSNLNSTSAIRFHAMEIILSYLVRFALFPLLGISVSIVVLYAIVLFPVIVFHHSSINIAAKRDLLFRKILVTPHMHRIHHSKAEVETNSNYGSIFPYWDRLFKSYLKMPAKEIKFGVD